MSNEIKLADYIKSLAEAVGDAQESLNKSVHGLPMCVTLYQFATKIHTVVSYDGGEIKISMTDDGGDGINASRGEVMEIGCIIEPVITEARTSKSIQSDSNVLDGAKGRGRR